MSTARVSIAPCATRCLRQPAAGDIDTVRSAIEAGFDPRLTDAQGRTVHQIAKEYGHEAIELLARELEERETAPAAHARRGRQHSRRRGERPRRQAAQPARQPPGPDRRPRRQFPEADRAAQGSMAQPARLRGTAARTRRRRAHPRHRRQRLCAALCGRSRRPRDRQAAGRGRRRRDRRRRRPSPWRARLGDLLSQDAPRRRRLPARAGREAQSLVGDRARPRSTTFAISSRPIRRCLRRA